MKEVFYLNQDALPGIPTPHDCIITEIKHGNDVLEFVFEDDISYHDSIKYFHPTAKSLIIRYHLLEDGFETYIQRRKKWDRRYVGYALRPNAEILGVQAHRMEYLYHYIAYQSIIIKLCLGNRSVILDAQVDDVEYEWVE